MSFTASSPLHQAAPPPLHHTVRLPDPGLADRIDAALPQTQCTRCGYPDCRAYAEAVASAAAPLNRCPPGGEAGIQRLAALTGRPALPLDADCGTEAPRLLAVIDEAHCIGCTLCIKACPVDCILGAPKRMHTVIDEQCTGCELCVPACPVDCIALLPVTTPHTGWSAWTAEQAAAARQRYHDRQARALRLARETDAHLAANATSAAAASAANTNAAATSAAITNAAAAAPAGLPAHGQHTDPAALARKRAVVEAALARARARQAARDLG